MRPLEGVTVVSVEQAIAAPFCTRQLADLGARVIKIERPDGGDFARGYDTRVNGLSSHFVWTNRSKESLAIDIKSPQGLMVLRKLLARADVFVQNLAPGAVERLGLTYEALSELNPRLIVCGVSGYGSQGPYAEKKAYDLLVQCEAGYLSVSGTRDEPVKAGCSIADISAGMYAYSSILAALIERSRTGRGRLIDLSMLECMVEWMGYPLYYAFEGAEPPPRSGAEHATIYPYGPFRTGDGRQVMLGIQNEREWAGFCRAVLCRPDLVVHPDYATNPARNRNRDALRLIIEDVFAGLTAAQAVDLLERGGIANANVNALEDVWGHPQLAARDRWRTVQTPAGEIPALLPPGASPDEPARMDPVPRVGEHNAAIFAELGIDARALSEG